MATVITPVISGQVFSIHDELGQVVDKATGQVKKYANRAIDLLVTGIQKGVCHIKVYSELDEKWTAQEGETVNVYLSSFSMAGGVAQYTARMADVRPIKASK